VPLSKATCFMGMKRVCNIILIFNYHGCNIGSHIIIIEVDVLVLHSFFEFLGGICYCGILCFRCNARVFT